MARTSAALCLWRHGPSDSGDTNPEVLIVHPGGPFWANKNEGAWSFPKGEFDPDAEDSLVAARREFGEEIGVAAPPVDDASYLDLGVVKQKGGKIVQGWAVVGDFDVSLLSSNTFELEWPPRSGRQQAFPEVDRAIWAHDTLARQLLNPAQAAFLDRLREALGRA